MGNMSNSSQQSGTQSTAVEIHESVSGFLGDAASWMLGGAYWLLAPIGRAIASGYANFGTWVDGVRAYIVQATDTIGFWWTLGYATALALVGMMVAYGSARIILREDGNGAWDMGRLVFFGAAVISIPGTVLSYFGATHLGPLVAILFLTATTLCHLVSGIARSGMISGLAYATLAATASLLMAPLITTVTVLIVSLVVAITLLILALFVSGF
ncbi:hypothetical protein [Niveispirillum cyanobacteriorum]|uniref:Uncharacterized protein n=1 Tax=Niveispirillum cyanobacteriorum TaxID=1612173 RepID=A0A2K9N8K4_9PROT|nr:hypothetical protein [Niveispirillum cyanobacteriorum]AUN29473.1 hypothetical protein C0V82_03905 [Niveispirillum cyanobacteriorum]GGE87491.1 hypothetical protein GCM10011317_50620 [Niveispirillum cyanobacteriorum]